MIRGPVTTEMPNQLSLFEGPYYLATRTPGTGDPVVLFEVWSTGQDGEVCDECGTVCTSSKECVEISGLYDEE